MTNLQPYPRYKDSGVEWLGDIPEDWELRRNRFIFRENKETVGKNSDDYTLLSLTLNGVIARDMENPQGKFPAEFNTYKQVETDDLIFCLFDIEETPRTVGIAKQSGMITGAYEVLTCKENINPNYLYYYYLSLDYNKRLGFIYSGLRKTININRFLSIYSPLPTMATQNRIVTFLDKKTQDIDKYIIKLKKEIKLLKEYRQKIISQAVTCGLDENGNLREKPDKLPAEGWKDSGIEWLGAIPNQWDLMKVRRIIKSHKQGYYTTQGYIEDGTKLVRISDITNRGSVDYSKMPYVSISESDKSIYKVYPGDFLFARTGGVGVFCLVELDNDAVFASYLIRFRFNNKLSDHFLKYIFMSDYFKTGLELDIHGGVNQNVHAENIKNQYVCFPNEDAQNMIVSFLDQKTKKINKQIEKIQQQIKLMNEYKQSLISKVVTGKVDVRDM